MRNHFKRVDSAQINKPTFSQDLSTLYLFKYQQANSETDALIQSIGTAGSVVIGRAIFAANGMVLKPAVLFNAYNLDALGIMFREAKFLLAMLFIEYHVMYCSHECEPAQVQAAMGAGQFMATMSYGYRTILMM